LDAVWRRCLGTARPETKLIQDEWKGRLSGELDNGRRIGMIILEKYYRKAIISVGLYFYNYGVGGGHGPNLAVTIDH
jgi:hypothetical protein